jgi:hypothetical protein
MAGEPTGPVSAEAASEEMPVAARDEMLDEDLLEIVPGALSVATPAGGPRAAAGS